MAEIPEQAPRSARAQKHYGVNQSLLHPSAMTSPHAMNSLNSFTSLYAFLGMEDVKASEVKGENQQSPQGDQTMTQENTEQTRIGDQYYEVSEQTTIDAMLADMANNLQADHELRQEAWGRQQPSEFAELKQDGWERQEFSHAQDSEQEQSPSQSQ